MRGNAGLLCGPLAALLLGVGIVILAADIPDYSQVRQTVSEIGEVGSPVQALFTILLWGVAILLAVFAWALRTLSLQAGRSPLAAYLTACMAVSSAGVGSFAFPHPLHNIFGMSETIGYCAPLAMALTWRRDPVASWSGILFVLVVVAMGLNLAVLDRDGALWAFERPIYGLIQRSLFACWFVWCSGVGLILQPADRGA